MVRRLVIVASTGTSRILGFPNPVNEKAARTVAAGVVVLTIAILVTQQWWLLVVLTYGLVARVATGPTLSPLGQLATRVVAPRLGAPKHVPGPPKRFAQAVGAAFTLTASLLHFAFGLDTVALALVAVIAVFATLESVFAFCMGCTAFGWLMRGGIIPERVCVECADLSSRLAARA